jgi:hypothetical protein
MGYLLGNGATVIDVVSLIYSDFTILHGLPNGLNAVLVLVTGTIHVVAKTVAIVKLGINDIDFVFFVWEWYKCI